MKRLTFVLTAFLLLACGGADAQKKSEPMKILVAYFSHSGNTRAMAEQIREATGADIFEIEPGEPYSSVYQEVLERGKREIKGNVKPPLKSMPGNLVQYDVIFVGSPNWWSTIAPPVATFLANEGLAGKTVVPFVTHGGGGMAGCEAAVKGLCPQSRMLKGLAVNGSSVKGAAPQVRKWLKEIGIVK